MSSEWMKVMLDEIARKREEAAQAQVELEQRRKESVERAAEPPGLTTPDVTTPDVTTHGVTTPGVSTPGVATPGVATVKDPAAG
jgi:hypothetical protein